MGAGHLRYKSWRLGNGYIGFEGYFSPDGASDPKSKGGGISVAHTATGRWTVTIDSSVNIRALLGLHATLHIADSDTDVHEVSLANVDESAGTFDIVHKASSDTTTTQPAAANLAAAATTRIYFGGVIAETEVAGSGL